MVFGQQCDQFFGFGYFGVDVGVFGFYVVDDGLLFFQWGENKFFIFNIVLVNIWIFFCFFGINYLIWMEKYNEIM